MLKNMRHELFCQAYIKHMFNATQAYKEVYPEAKHPTQRAHTLLQREDIQNRVEELKGLLYEESVASKIEVLMKLTEVVREETHETWSVGQQLKALELLGKYHSLYTEKVEHSSKDFTIELIDDED